MPGAHSDIGGGYSKESDEDTLLWDEANDVFMPSGGSKLLMYYYILEGWYKDKEIEREFTFKALRNEVYGRRKKLTNKYAVIPLQIMGEYSDRYKAAIDLCQLEAKFNTNNCSLLKDVEIQIKEEILDKEKISNNFPVMPFDRGNCIKNRWAFLKENWSKFKKQYDGDFITKKALKKEFKKIRLENNYLSSICKIFNVEDTVREDLEKDYKKIKKNWSTKRQSIIVSSSNPPPSNLEYEESEEETEEEIFSTINLDEVLVTAYSGGIIKALRNRYLHISHNYWNTAWVLEPHKPSPDYKRIERKG